MIIDAIEFALELADATKWTGELTVAPEAGEVTDTPANADIATEIVAMIKNTLRIQHSFSESSSESSLAAGHNVVGAI
jgi:hypothetical protein